MAVSQYMSSNPFASAIRARAELLKLRQKKKLAVANKTSMRVFKEKRVEGYFESVKRRRHEEFDKRRNIPECYAVKAMLSRKIEWLDETQKPDYAFTNEQFPIKNDFTVGSLYRHLTDVQVDWDSFLDNSISLVQSAIGGRFGFNDIHYLDLPGEQGLIALEVDMQTIQDRKKLDVVLEGLRKIKAERYKQGFADMDQT